MLQHLHLPPPQLSVLLAFRGFHSLHRLPRLRLVLVVRSLDRLLKIWAPLEDKASVELVLLVSLRPTSTDQLPS